MSEFKFKTYRCEWLVKYIGIDQYGEEIYCYKTHAFTSYDEAKANLPLLAVEHEFVKSRWIPKDDLKTEYKQAVIGYREVEVKE